VKKQIPGLKHEIQSETGTTKPGRKTSTEQIKAGTRFSAAQTQDVKKKKKKLDLAERQQKRNESFSTSCS
jgi:hypothetical protein